MNLLALFVVFLQVLTVLCTKCYTNNRFVGNCACPFDCNLPDDSPPLTRCADTGLYCCPEGYSSVPPIVKSKFPTDCGKTPMYPRGHIVGGDPIQPDEYSWLAALRYGDSSVYGFCGGSVINSRYVLTAAHCVKGVNVVDVGNLTGVRLGAYDVNKNICDYGNETCTHYQQFGIDDIIVHSGYKYDLYNSVHDIALIRLDRPILFGKKLKPICLPFEDKAKYEPEVGTFLTISGWGRTMQENDTPEKRDAVISPTTKEDCKKKFRVNDTHICAVGEKENTCSGDSGGPLMYQFSRRAMLLIGVVSYGGVDCTNTTIPGVYTKVRNYEQWLNDNMHM